MTKVSYEMVTTASLVKDIETGADLPMGSIITTNDRERVRKAIDNKLTRISAIRHQNRPKGNKILVYCSYLAPFGGIETATLELVKRYGAKYNITLAARQCQQDMAFKIGEYVDFIYDSDVQEYDLDKGDVLIVVQYDAAGVINKVTGHPKVYQQNHAVWDMLPNLKFKSIIEYGNKIDTILSVSDEARRGLIARYDKDSVVVPNIISAPGKSVVFGFFSRSSAEKGFDTIMPAIKKFRQYGKPFVFVVSTSAVGGNANQIYKLSKEPEVIMLQGGIDNRSMIPNIDFLWQLSTIESMGLSVYEALLSGTPVVASKISTFEEIIENGKTGFLVEHDLSDLPVEKIFKMAEQRRRQPMINLDEKGVDEIWDKVFRGLI